MKYPKYTREENLSSKLTDEDIQDIQSRLLKGETQRSIAKVYRISQPTVSYWSLTLEERRKREKIKKQQTHQKSYKERKDYFKSYRKRKLTLSPELRDYELENAKKQKQKPDYIQRRKRIEKRYYEKHKEEILKRNKEYNMKNPQVHKKSMKRYRQKIKKLGLDTRVIKEKTHEEIAQRLSSI